MGDANRDSLRHATTQPADAGRQAPGDPPPFDPARDIRPTLSGAASPLVAGDRLLDRYQLRERVGEGAVGVVYRAWDERLKRPVAVKILSELMALQQKQIARFAREAEVLAALTHPNVATILDVACDPSDPTLRPAIVLEWIQGESLAQTLRAGPQPIARALSVAAQIAAGLEAAHELGIIHRDLKPANVMLATSGHVKVLDFGLARTVRPAPGEPGGDAVTEAGMMSGTPGYMSPEQLQDGPVDERSDVWALGCVLYRCLTGQRAFDGRHIAERMAATLRREPDFTRLPDETPEQVRILLRRCLSKDPEQRPRSAREIRQALESTGPASATVTDAPAVSHEPSLPTEPYPLLAPYQHAQTFGGRRREVEELGRLLEQDRLLLGVHAASGAGKTSLLLAGLVPELAAAGVPVAVDRHPEEPGLPRRLLAALLGREPSADEEQPVRFAARLAEVGERAAATPTLIIDQLDHLFRSRDRSTLLARLGPVLAATAGRLPNGSFPCRWVLAYRRDYHGEVVVWLEDVLAEARRAGDELAAELPHDLATPDRFTAWTLPLLGQAGRGDEDRSTAVDAFLDAIEHPLQLRTASGEPYFSYRFAGDGAARLAQAFASARARRRDAPLLPELQVVLSHLLEGAVTEPDGVREIRVPADPESLIDEALEEHLRRSIDDCFPLQRTVESARRRTHALLALRELADEDGRRGYGLLEQALVQALGEDGEQVLARLAGPKARLIVPQTRADGVWYRLSHDRIAALVLQLFEDEGLQRRCELDDEVLALRRFVAQRASLYVRSDDAAAIDLSARQHRRIDESKDSLLLDDDRRRWWRAVRRRRGELRRRRRRRWAVALALAGVVAVTAVAAWIRLDQQLLLRDVAAAEPQRAFQALIRLVAEHRPDPAELILPDADGQYVQWARTFVEGPWADEAGDPRVAEQTLAVLDWAIPVAGRSSTLFGALVHVADEVAVRTPGLETRAREVHDRIVSTWPVSPPAPDDDGGNPRITIPGGRFRMGAAAGDPSRNDDELPQHEVLLSKFRLQSKEVSNREFRRFDPNHNPAAPPGVPVDVSWYQARGYAAWVGGDLPTEAQWEYAARAGTDSNYSCGDDSRCLDEFAWFVDNSDDRLQPVGTRRANRLGLFDMYGNSWEWCRDVYSNYTAGVQLDPLGPVGAGGLAVASMRVTRGGSFYSADYKLRSAYRNAWSPATRSAGWGFRVAWPGER